MWYSSSCTAFFSSRFSRLKSLDHRLDGDHSPREDYDAEAPDQDVAEKMMKS
jgi:hypothetical protein